jgi:hypothetical protein
LACPPDSAGVGDAAGELETALDLGSGEIAAVGELFFGDPSAAPMITRTTRTPTAPMIVVQAGWRRGQLFRGGDGG